MFEDGTIECLFCGAFLVYEEDVVGTDCVTCDQCNTPHSFIPDNVWSNMHSEVVNKYYGKYKDHWQRHLLDVPIISKPFFDLWELALADIEIENYHVEVATFVGTSLATFAAWRIDETITLENAAKICDVTVDWMTTMVERKEIVNVSVSGEGDSLAIQRGNNDFGLFPHTLTRAYEEDIQIEEGRWHRCREQGYYQKSDTYFKNHILCDLYKSYMS